MYLGDLLPGQPVKFPWSTNAKTGEAVPRSVQGAVRVYKSSTTTEFTAGVLDVTNFDGVTGLQYGVLDTTDPFYVAHEDYTVALVGAIIDTQNVNAILGCFSILNRGTNALLTPGVISGVTLPSQGRVFVDGITHPSGRFRHRQIYSGYGASVPNLSAVIATHTLTSGRADLTFVSNTDLSFGVGDRVLVI